MPGPEPPLLLAIETATTHTSVALARGEEILDEQEASPEIPAAACLMPAIDALLGRNRIRLAQIGALALSVGPGSFTGLRIGVATVKGLAFGVEVPVVAVPTLEALALGAGEGVVVATLDARRGELYAAGYAIRDGAPSRDLVEGLFTASELLARLPPVCRIVGEADAVAGAALRAGLGPGQQLEPGPSRLPRAREVAVLAAGRLARGDTVRAAELVPRYLRRAEAEARRLGEAVEGPAEAL